MTQHIHPTAQTGFDRAAQAYTKGRPDYPSQALDFLASDLGFGPSTRLLDVGAGTGKFTHLLAQRRWNVTAVEPVAGMRAEFQKQVPDVKIFEGSAESLPFQDGAFDAVVVAQAFHWFRGREALREFHRVLAPGGRLVLIWNARDESVPWVQTLTALLAPFEGETPRYTSGRWREAFAQPSIFTPLHSKSFRHDQQGNVDILVDRVASISFVAALDGPEKTELLSNVRALGESVAPDSTLTIPYRTDLYWCSKSAQA